MISVYLHVHYRYAGLNSQSKEVNHNKIAPAMQEQNPSSSPRQTQQVALHLSGNEVMQDAMLNKTSDDFAANVIVEVERKSNRKKSGRFCCFNVISG